MTSPSQVTENSTIEKLTFAELETLVTTIVNKTISQTPNISLNKTFDPTAKPISEIAAELAAEIPDEAWDLLPSNASELVDEYLYGFVRE